MGKDGGRRVFKKKKNMGSVQAYFEEFAVFSPFFL